MILRPLTKDDMEQIREWRHQVMGTLRTPYMLTKEMQQEYYKNVICNRDSHTRYWAFAGDKTDPDYMFLTGIIGYGGVENIEWENRRAEISVLINPEYHGRGHGSQAVKLILDQAFNYLNLDTVFGECYYSGPVGFWVEVLERRTGYPYQTSNLPMKKYHGGKYHAAFYFTIFKTNQLRDISAENILDIGE